MSENRPGIWPSVVAMVLGVGILANAVFWGYLLIFIAPFGAAMILIGVIGLFTRNNRVLHVINAVAALAIVVSMVNLVFFVGVERTVVHAMRWAEVDPSEEAGPCADLTYVQWPSRFHRICSPEAMAYLRGKGESATVEVELSVVYDWREARGYHLEALDGRRLCSELCADGILATTPMGGSHGDDSADTAGSPLDWALSR